MVFPGLFPYSLTEIFLPSASDSVCVDCGICWSRADCRWLSVQGSTYLVTATKETSFAMVETSLADADVLNNSFFLVFSTTMPHSFGGHKFTICTIITHNRSYALEQWYTHTTNRSVFTLYNGCGLLICINRKYDAATDRWIGKEHLLNERKWIRDETRLYPMVLAVAKREWFGERQRLNPTVSTMTTPSPKT